MRLPRLSREAGLLIRDIGAGRRLHHHDAGLTLRYALGAGDGLLLRAEADGQPIQLWVCAEQWCQWIAPQLQVPNWSNVNPELHPLLASWTLACVADSLGYCGFVWPSGLALEAVSVPVAPYCCLDLEQEGRHLQVWVLEAPQPWLESLVATLDPLEVYETLGDQAIPVPLIAGWGRIEQQILAQLQPGDALLLNRRYATAAGQLGLFLNRPLGTVAANDFATYTLEAVMDDFNDWLDTTPSMPDATCTPPPDLLVSVVAQVASIDVPLQQLASLQVGDVLEGAARLEDGVLLTVAGRTIAHGLLLDIDGRLAVRIERLV